MSRPRAKRRPRRRGRPDPSFSAHTEILLGAARAFGDKGYADTSVEDVLKAAGVSRRTFYRFFRNKEELFEALFDAASMIFLQSTRNAAAIGKTPEEKLANCLELWLRAPQTAGPIFHVMQLEAQRPGTRLAARREAAIEALIAMLDEGIRQERGYGVDPLVLRGLIASADAISLYVYAHTPAGEDELRRAKAAMVHIIGSALAEDKLAQSDLRLR